MEEALFSSKSDEWETPDDLFSGLNKVFGFTLDPCATTENAKCQKFYTMNDDGLNKSWEGESVFVNPPYGLTIGKWVRKCAEESSHARVVLLIPARTDTKYQHEWIFPYAYALCFVNGRLRFTNRLLPSYDKSGNFKKSPAPFPSQIIVYFEINNEQKSFLEEYGTVLCLK